jgi:hypothetical protein
MRHKPILFLLLALTLLLLPGCAIFGPPPAAQPTTQPASNAVKEFVAVRTAYLDTIRGATLARTLGKLSDADAVKVETARQLSSAYLLTAEKTAVRAEYSEASWQALEDEQKSVEALWIALLPAPAKPSSFVPQLHPWLAVPMPRYAMAIVARSMSRS